MKLMKKTIALRYWLTGRQYWTALKALEYASKYHTGKRKDNVTPEIEHQISIASFIRTISPSLISPESSLTVAFLHDTPEDYNVPFSELTDIFGEKITHSVGLLTKKYKGSKKDLTLYYNEIAGDQEASIVKGVDRVHNIQTSHAVFSMEGQLWYIEESETYIQPMLQRARRTFPEQEMAYENIKHILNSQIELIKAIHKTKKEK
jgi:(p)ppGpp synthase/HD superfamily hydrolase